MNRKNTRPIVVIIILFVTAICLIANWGDIKRGFKNGWNSVQYK